MNVDGARASAAEQALLAAGGPALVAFVDRVVTLLRHGLPGLRGVWLVGSLASGDARGGASDVDLMVAADIAGTQDDWLALGEQIADIGATCPLRGVELVVYSAQALARPDCALTYALNVNAGPAMDRTVSTGGDPTFWFVLDVAAARTAALPLLGPAVTEMVGAIEDDVVAEAIAASFDWHSAGRPDADAVLNACRAWRWSETGAWVSKTAAGEWAQAMTTPGRDASIVAAALAARRAGRDTQLDESAVHRLLALVRAAINA